MSENDEYDKRVRELAASGASLSEIAAKLVEAAKARTELDASPKMTVNKIAWAQVGRVTEPGRYLFRFGWLTVTAEDLAIWQQFPGAAFTLVPHNPSEDGDEYRLGLFDIGDRP
jgi:hypothetical protein